MSYLELAKRAITETNQPSKSTHSPCNAHLEAVHHDADVLEARHDFIAVRFYSRLLDRDFWLARDERTAAELSAEFPGVPVLVYAEVAYLRGKPPGLLRAVLDAKAEFPAARLAQ